MTYFAPLGPNIDTQYTSAQVLAGDRLTCDKVNAGLTTTNRAAILVKPKASTSPSVTSSENGEEDDNAEVTSTSPESIRQLHRALPSATDTAVVVVTSTLGQTTLDAPLGNRMSYGA